MGSDFTKSLVTFLAFFRGILLYIIIHMALFWAVALIFWVPPSWLEIDFKSISSIFFGYKAILGHEGDTQKFRAVAQNKAIQIRFQMI